MPLQTRHAAFALLFAFLIGCGGERTALTAQVEEFRLVREEDGKQVVTGFLVNPTDRDLSSAVVYVDLYDQPVEPGVEPVETMQVEVREIAPGERKRFRQTVDTRLTLSGARSQRIVVR